MSFGSPKMSTAPTPVAPQLPNEDIQAAGNTAVRNAQGAGGFSSTILTGATGLTKPDNVGMNTLLGD